MAAYQDNNNMNHFLLKIMSGFMEDGTINSNSFYPPLAGPILHETTTPPCNCLDHSSKQVALDDKEPSDGDQKVISPINKKRKSGSGSRSRSRSSSITISVQSKDDRERKGKKQKQCNGEGKEKQKPKGEPLTGYIHVRARRGQATDSHSLAERVRREKISEKMKTLQRLVPGCDKVSGKALMLDEIISYVQSLQNQVEFLSMKIASVNPMFFDLSLEQEQQDSFIFNLEERLNASPLQQCSPNEPTVFATNISVIPNTYTPLDSTSAFSHQDNANLLWDVDEQSIWIQ